MTALEKARRSNPDLRPDQIIHYGCPDRHGVGTQPDWCANRVKLGKTCKDCWNRESDTSELTCGWCQKCDKCKKIKQFCEGLISTGRKNFPSYYDIFVYEIYNITDRAMYIGFQLHMSGRFIGKLEEMKYEIIKSREPYELLYDVTQRIKKAK